MAEQAPFVTYHEGSDSDPGIAVANAFDELAAYAFENGCSETDLHEQLDAAIERTE